MILTRRRNSRKPGAVGGNKGQHAQGGPDNQTTTLLTKAVGTHLNAPCLQCREGIEFGNSTAGAAHVLSPMNPLVKIVGDNSGSQSTQRFHRDTQRVQRAFFFFSVHLCADSALSVNYHSLPVGGGGA
jgi:hypothetical protein